MIADRLKKYLDYKDISIYAFENAIGCSRGLILKAIKENKNIGSQIIENILCSFPDLDADWLLTGQGQMLKENIGHIQTGHTNTIDNSPININANTVEIERLNERIKHLEDLLSAKEEIINLLKNK